MLPSLKDVAVFLDASPTGQRVGQFAAAIAARHQAHLIGIHGAAREHTGAYVRGGAALQEVIDRRMESDERQGIEAGRYLAALSLEHGISSEFRVVWKHDEEHQAPLRSLHCDLIVSAQPQVAGLPDTWSAEALVLTTGIPVLMFPAAWEGGQTGRHVLIAWNRSREARRAVADALPFIHAADQVTVLAIDTGRLPRLPEPPGSHLVEHLGRHGIKAELAVVEGGQKPVAEVILTEATARGADLVVMGAYSRARAAQVLFGGTTRTMLGDATLPVLMSR